MNKTYRICTVISGPSLREAIEQIKQVSGQTDLLEFRWDLIQDWSLEDVRLLREGAQLPVVFTLRSRTQGGEFEGDEKARLFLVHMLATLSPDYFDLESDVEPSFFEEMVKTYSKIHWICSYHDWEETSALEEVYSAIHRRGASLYKMVTFAQSSLDALRMLQLVKQCEGKLIGFCMGSEGQFSRVLAPVMGSPMTYAAVDAKAVAPGQMTVEACTELNLRQLGKEIEIFGLIGDPVDQSPSRETHNRILHALGQKALYLSFRVEEEFLDAFLCLAGELGIHGLSVTMPLKQHVARVIGSDCSSINTLRFRKGRWEGCNTDGKGAVHLLETVCQLKDSCMVILGAGGVAQAIAQEAKSKGVKVVFLNRTLEHVRQVAKKIGGDWGSLDDFRWVASEGYDILVQCTPLGMRGLENRIPIPEESILAHRICLETVARQTPFSLAAKSKGCVVFSGIDLFFEQAKRQFLWWYEDRFSIEEIEEVFDCVCKEGENVDRSV